MKRPQLLLYLFATLCLASLNIGCAAYSASAQGFMTKRYFGWLEVTTKANPADTAQTAQQTIKQGQIERVRTIGLRVSNGVAIGYTDDAMISLPLDCRLVIVVKTIEQIRQIAETYPQLLKTEHLCVKSMDF
jgi:hypothetical protein